VVEHVQTHPNIHRLFGVVDESDFSTIQKLLSPLNLPMGDDYHSHPHGESDKRSSIGSVALCEWKGKSLRMFLEERYGTDGEELLFEEIVDLLLDISRGVQHLHAHGCVHGNLTSHSILVEHSSQHDRYHAVVSDVGLWDRNGFDMTGGGGGGGGWGDGIRWMAPEIMSPEGGGMIGKCRSFASDVWSFGMVMSEMVNGNIPFSSIQAPIGVVFALGSGRGLEREVGYGFDHPLCHELMEHCVLRDVPSRPFMTNIIHSLEGMR
jgi:serine/threonine protein kinase